MESLALDDYIQANHEKQTLLEMAQACGVSSTTAFRHSKALGLHKYEIDSNRVINHKAKERIEIVGNVTRHKLI